MILEQLKESYKNFSNRIDSLDKEGLLKEIHRISNIKEEKYADISFCILLIFWTETILKELLSTLLLDSFRPEKRYPELVNLIFDETTFCGKIKITKFIINASPRYKEGYKSFFSFCETLNQTRNQIFHSKLNSITYGKLSIYKIKTQRKMLRDLISARLKMNI